MVQAGGGTRVDVQCGSTTDACYTEGIGGGYLLNGGMTAVAVPEVGMPVEKVVALIGFAILAGFIRHTSGKDRGEAKGNGLVRVMRG
jgi:hypothetical protein